MVATFIGFDNAYQKLGTHESHTVVCDKCKEKWGQRLRDVFDDLRAALSDPKDRVVVGHVNTIFHDIWNSVVYDIENLKEEDTNETKTMEG